MDEVHKLGICQQCGGCVSFCNSVDKNVIGFKNQYTPPVYLNKEKCLECGLCYLICPQTRSLEQEINDRFKFSDFSSTPLGFYYNIHSCQANDENFLNHGTDGGVVNSILHYLLEKNLIDGAIVARNIAPFSREAFIARTEKELIEASGVKLTISTQLEEVQKFHSYTNSLPKLKQIQFKKLAVVGTPCQIYTIRCMQNLDVVPSENIEICFGLFCYENFFFDKTQVIKLENDFNIKFEDIEKINIKEDLIIKLKNDKDLHILFNKLEDYMRPACRSCRDFTNIYSDISFGGLGSEEKFTTILPRTEKGRTIISKVIKAGVINCLKLDQEIKTKMKNIITQISQAKIERYRNFYNKK